MKEPILSREEVAAAIDAAKAKWNAEADQFNQWCDLGDDERYELVAAAFESAILEKLCGEPVAFVCSSDDDFAPIVRSKSAAQKLSDEHGDGKIVPLYALNRSKA